MRFNQQNEAKRITFTLQYNHVAEGCYECNDWCAKCLLSCWKYYSWCVKCLLDCAICPGIIVCIVLMSISLVAYNENHDNTLYRLNSTLLQLTNPTTIWNRKRLRVYKTQMHLATATVQQEVCDGSVGLQRNALCSSNVAARTTVASG